MKVYVDIETIPGQSPALRQEIAASVAPPGNYKKVDTLAKWEDEQKPAQVEEAWRRTSFDGDRGEIVCIAWAVEDAPIDCVYRALKASETTMLADFFLQIQGEVTRRHGLIPHWIGHNVADFDLRFLFQRAVILGLEPPFRLSQDARPGGDFVSDTMTAWAGYRNRISLDRLCKALGIATKGTEPGGEDIDGSKVWDFVKAERIEEVALYCRADVDRVRRVYKRLMFESVAEGLE
jgi:predicted PolB exonuclease-like 3'-5' exonuclease